MSCQVFFLQLLRWGPFPTPFSSGPNYLLLVRKLGDKKGRAEAAQLVADVHFALASMGLGNPQARTVWGGGGVAGCVSTLQRKGFFSTENWFCGEFLDSELTSLFWNGMEWENGSFRDVILPHLPISRFFRGDLRTLMTRDGNIQPNRAKSPAENGYQRSIGLTGISKLPMNVW